MGSVISEINFEKTVSKGQGRRSSKSCHVRVVLEAQLPE